MQDLHASSELEVFQRLAAALGIGLLIGLERGWQARQRAEGKRPAGIRTFGLIGFSGALATLLANELGPSVLVAMFLAVAALLVVGHVLYARVEHDFGVTTQVAGMLTFVLGCLAMAGYLSVAVASAVVATVILGLKPTLHRWVEGLEGGELHALFRLLLMSAVILPVLPNRELGPWNALNPRAIGWLVVLVAIVSFVGYFAVKIAGPRKGIGLTATFGGLASSTATTLSFSRMARGDDSLAPLLASGVLIACTIMFARVFALVAAVNPGLVGLLAWPLGAMTLVGALISFLMWRRARNGREHPIQLSNPVEIRKALQFAALLAAIGLLAHGFRETFGQRGLYYLAGISGAADVDAITLSLARMTGDQGVDPAVAARSIALATMSNSLVKAGMAWFLAGHVMGRRVMLSLLAVSAAGGIVLWFV